MGVLENMFLAARAGTEYDPFAEPETGAVEPVSPFAETTGGIAAANPFEEKPENPFAEVAPPNPFAESKTRGIGLGVADYPIDAAFGVLRGGIKDIGTKIQGLAAPEHTIRYGRGAMDPGYFKMLREAGIPEEDVADAAQTEATRVEERAKQPIPRLETTETFKAGSAVGKFGEETFKKSGKTHPILEDVYEGVGSLGTGLATGLVPGVGLPLAVGTSLLGGMGEAAERASKSKTATPEQQLEAAYVGTVPGSTDLIDNFMFSPDPKMRLLGLAGKVGRSWLNRTGKKVLVGAGAEGLQEGIQELMQGEIEKGIYNPELSRSKIWGDAAYSAFIGAIIGGAAKPILDKDTATRTYPLTPKEIEDVLSSLSPSEKQDALMSMARVRIPSTGSQATDVGAVDTEYAPGTRTWSVNQEKPDGTGAERTAIVADPGGPIWYSPLRRFVVESLPDRIYAPDLMTRLYGKGESGLKIEELKTVDLAGFLWGKKYVTKEELVDFLDENAITLHEVIGSDAPVPFKTQNEALEWMRNFLSEEEQAEAYSNMDWKRDNYEDSTPHTEALRWFEEKKLGIQTKLDSWMPGEGTKIELRLTMPGLRVRGQHVFADDTVVWGRIQLMKDPITGATTAHLHEIQTDLHQKAEGMGGYVRGTVAEADAAEQFMFKKENELRNLVDDERWLDEKSLADKPYLSRARVPLNISEVMANFHNGFPGAKMREEPEIPPVETGMKNVPRRRVPPSKMSGAATYTSARNQYSKRFLEYSPQIQKAAADYTLASEAWNEATQGMKGQTNAPFKSTQAWTKLMIRRTMKWAADRGISQISFSTGDSAILYAAGNPAGAETRKGLKYYYDQVLPRIVKEEAKRWGGRVNTRKMYSRVDNFSYPETLAEATQLGYITIDHVGPLPKPLPGQPPTMEQRLTADWGDVFRIKADNLTRYARDYGQARTFAIDMLQHRKKQTSAFAVLSSVDGGRLFVSPRPVENYEIMTVEITPEMMSVVAKEPMPMWQEKQVIPRPRVELAEGFNPDQYSAELYLTTVIPVVETLNQLLNKFGLHPQVTIFLTDNIPTSTPGTMVLGTLTRLKEDMPGARLEQNRENGTYELYLNLSALGEGSDLVVTRNPREQLYNTMTHEFGHLLMMELWGTLTDQQRIAIDNAYIKYSLSRNPDLNLHDISKRRSSAMFTWEFEGREKKISLQSLSPEKREYEYNKKEWFADQIARWATTNEVPLTIADKAMAGLAKRLKTYEEEATKKYGRPFTAEPAVVEWANSFVGDVVPTFMSNIEDSRRIETRRENQKQLDKIDPGLKAFEMQPETEALHRTLRNIIKELPEEQAKVVATLPAQVDVFNKVLKYGATIYQLGEFNPGLQPLQRYIEYRRFAGHEESLINAAAEETMKDWMALGKEQSDALASLIDDVTNMVFRSPQEVAQKIERHPTRAEAQALITKYKVGADALRVFTSIKQRFDAFLTISEQLALAEARQKIQNPGQLAQVEADIRAATAKIKSKPFFPFTGFGRFGVIVRDNTGATVERVQWETEKEKAAGLPVIFAAYPASIYNHQSFTIGDEGGGRTMAGMPVHLLDMVEKRLVLTTNQKAELDLLKHEVSAGSKFTSRFKQRRIPGYSNDFQRAFAQYFVYGARWYVKAKYAPAMRQQGELLEASSLTAADPKKRTQITEAVKDDMAHGFLDPTPDFVAIKSFLVFMTLAFVPATAAVNMSQVPMVAYPFSVGKYGRTTATRAYTKAIAKWQNYYKRGTIQNLTSFEARAIEYGIESGRLSQGFGVELGSWAQGTANSTLYLGKNPVSQSIHALNKRGLWMFEMAEKWSRRVTFSAALDLAQKQPGNRHALQTLPKFKLEIDRLVQRGFSRAEANAIALALHAVEQTQGVAASDVRPRFMRGKLGTIFLYKRVIQALLMMTAANKADVAWRTVLMMLLLGGLSGPPGYEDLKEISKVLGNWMFDTHFDLDKFLREYIKELTSTDWAADMVLKGASGSSFGIPWLLNHMGSEPWFPEFDISRSMGFGTSPLTQVRLGAIPGLGPTGLKDPKEVFGEETARAGGVMGNLALNTFKAVAGAANSPADFKAYEAMMPRFLRNLSHSYRAITEGRERGRSDATVIPYNIHDPREMGEILGLAAGFQPSRLTAKWEQLQMQSEHLKYIDTQRKQIFEEWTKFERRGMTDEEREKMRKTILEFNAGLRPEEKPLSITSDTLKRSVEERRKRQEIQDKGLSQNRTQIPVIQHIQGLFPKAPVDVSGAVPRRVGPAPAAPSGAAINPFADGPTLKAPPNPFAP